MSVALPRPLNASTNPNLAARPTTSTPSASLKARPTMPTNGHTNGKMAIPARPSMVSRPSTASTSSTPVASGSNSKDTSSSAGKVFAKPSKEWVLPERAKPGRKVCAEEPDNKRQSQNRLSQRAHRARRTDYITTLEDRLRQYEADEIHSNVRLQEVARALKGDNERMKNELMLIKGKMNELYGEKEGWESEKKNLEEMCASLMVEVERLRSGGNIGSGSGGGLKLEPSVPSGSGSGRRTDLPTPTARFTMNAPKEKRTPVACPICPDPDPDCPCQQPQSQAVTPIIEPHHSDCGLCQNSAECLCRIVNDEPIPAKSAKGKCDVCPSLAICLCEDDSPPPPKVSAAVPLSLRLKSKSSGIDTGPKKTFWKLDNVIKKGEAVCSGDPSNCDACRDDTFGKEFCGQLFGQPSATQTKKKPCINCPGNCMDINNLLSPANPNEGFVVDVQPPTPPMSAEDHETMRCDEAWKKLKAHPNAKFASLALLADVVAGRTKCTGPTIELSPTPTPSPSPLPPPSIGVGSNASALGISTHSHSHVNTQALAPHGGIKRRMGVETSAVRDALRMLDSTPSRATSEVEGVKMEPIDLDEVNERAAKKIRIE